MPAVTWCLWFYGLIRWTAPCITGAKPVSGPNCHTVRTRNGLISPCALYDKPLYDNKGYWRPILIWLPLETILDGCLFSWEWQGFGSNYTWPFIVQYIIAKHGFESASFLVMKERIDENHPWVTDDACNTIALQKICYYLLRMNFYYRWLSRSVGLRWLQKGVYEINLKLL